RSDHMSNPLNGVTSADLSVHPNDKQVDSSGKAQSDFADALKDALKGVNNAQEASNKKTADLASGQVDELHDVMVTAQKANITLETSVQIQQKVIDAYNDVMRMQV